LELAVTAVITSVFIFNEDAKFWLYDHIYIFIVGAVGAAIISFVLFCYRSVARTVPINYILLIAFTLFQSIIVSCICIFYSTDKIFYALGITIAVCVGLALFAIFAPCDFTGCGPYLCVLMIVLVLLGLLMFFIKSKILVWIYVGLGLLLFSLYLVYDIQLMVGKRRNQYSEDDYIIAALSIYIDVIHIFIYILTIFGLLDN
ncbi:GH25207, partial [Drosophila grimshawi]